MDPDAKAMDTRLAQAHFAACAPFEADVTPCTVLRGRPSAPGVLMPLVCFQCGMVLNNKQNWFQKHHPSVPPLELFTALHLSICCRINISRAAKDPRLHFDAPFTSSLVSIERAPRLQAPPTTMPTDGRTLVFEKPGVSAGAGAGAGVSAGAAAVPGVPAL